MWLRLWDLLDSPCDDDWAYVYRIDALKRPITPYAAKYWLPCTDLIFEIRREFGGGLFRVLIREGRTMKFSGMIGIEVARV